MATLKAVVLKHQIRADGTVNVKIRVTHERKSAYIATEHYIPVKKISADFTRIKDNFILSIVEEEISRLRREISDLGVRIHSLDAKGLAIYLESLQDGDHVDIFEYGRKRIESLLSKNREGTSKTYQYSLKRLGEFIGREKLDMKEITPHLLRNFEKYILSGNRGLRTLELVMSNIRTLISEARSEYNDEDNRKFVVPNPFARYMIPKAPDPQKRSLSPAEFTALRIADLPRQSKQHSHPFRRDLMARDLFLLSFFLVGMNSCDLYEMRPKQIKDGYLTYERRKTRTRRQDRAEIKIKLIPEALELMEKYKDPTGERVLIFYRYYSNFRNFGGSVDLYLKEIGRACGIDGLTFYAARHTWATIAYNDCGISVDDIALSLNHNDITKKTTFKYIRKDFAKIDEANRIVVDYVNQVRDQLTTK